MNQKDKQLHEKFCKNGRNAKEWIRKCVLMLPHIEKNRIWKKKGFNSIHEYAGKLAGMSRYQVNEGLRIMRKTENLPELRELIKTKGINIIKPVATIADEQTDKFWAKKAKEMSKNTLETFVKDYKNQGLPRKGYPTNNSSNKPNKIQILMKLDPKIAKQLHSLKADTDWNELMKKFIKLTQKPKKKKPAPVKTTSRHITKPIKTYIKERSHDICEQPRCTNKAKHFHHSKPFSRTKEHDPDKILHLCKAHHKLIHLGHIDETKSWQLIESLPWYDIRHRINNRIIEHQT